MSQNAVAAAAYAGAITVAENIAEPGSRTDANVAAAVAAAAGQTATSDGDGVDAFDAFYTDGFGTLLSPVVEVGGGALPANARGVNVVGSRDVETTFARLPPVSMDVIRATAEATAVAGVTAGPCPTDEPCVILPVTMPVSFGDTICDEDLDSLGLENPMNEWIVITDPEDPLQTTPENMSVLPLCITASGDFSWLDLGPDNLQQEILNPAGQEFSIPDWLQTQPGNPNSAEGEINTYRDVVVLIPMWQGLCGSDPGTYLDPCTDPTVSGNNAWYNVPYMRPLLLEGAYIQGDNRNDCEVSGVTWPTEATVQGLVGCLKGWWLDTTVTGGPIDPNTDPTDPQFDDASISVNLIK
jgi:hypothetical protein